MNRTEGKARRRRAEKIRVFRGLWEIYYFGGRGPAERGSPGVGGVVGGPWQLKNSYRGILAT